MERSKNLLKQKTNDFLNNKTDISSLQYVINSFKESKERRLPLITHLLCCESIFVDLLKCRDMIIPVVPLKQIDQSPENVQKLQLRCLYEDIFELVLECFYSEKQSEAQQALITSMKLLSIEGQNPLDDHLNQQPFPVLQLKKVISKLLLSEKNMKNIVIRLSDYAIYDDFCFFTWKLLLNNFLPTDKNALTTIFIQNYLEILNIFIPSSKTLEQRETEDEKKFLCKSVKLDLALLKKNVNKIWNFVIQWPHDETTHHQLLVLLLEKVLAYLDKPTMLTDYLMDSLDVGGQISLLALQGIFILIHKHNMSYPNIYEKLYMMFEPEIFHMKYKPRLFHLADIFLTSTYLPETLVAAFTKRLARLALIAPPQDIIIIIYFIGNLIIRHPGLKRLICDKNCNEQQEIAQDPFIMEEADPNKSQALSSSLWEIQLLRNHMLPNVSQAAKNILTQPLPSNEYDLGNYLEVKESDLFDDEITKKCRENIALTFNRPDLKTPHSAIYKYWNF